MWLMLSSVIRSIEIQREFQGMPQTRIYDILPKKESIISRIVQCAEQDRFDVIWEIRHSQDTSRPGFQGEMDNWFFNIGLQTSQVCGVHATNDKVYEV
jgi:hypothetical protein